MWEYSIEVVPGDGPRRINDVTPQQGKNARLTHGIWGGMVLSECR